jgi:hypothetical protein
VDGFEVDTEEVAPIWVPVVFADEDVAVAVAVDVEPALEVPALVAALASVEVDADVTLLGIVEVKVDVCVRREEVLVELISLKDSPGFVKVLVSVYVMLVVIVVMQIVVVAIVAVLLRLLMLVKLKVKGLVEMGITVVEVMVVV